MDFESGAVGRLNSLRRDTVRKLRQVGVLETFKHGATKLIRDLTSDLAPQDDPKADPFDARFGTDTARIVSVGALDIPDGKLAHSNRYEAVMPAAFDAIMRDLPIDHRDYVFVDIGCGKGRALLLASRFPFKRIIGVEISAALTEIARNNIRIYDDEAQKCRDIETMCVDGSAYEPPVDRTVLYLHNPFDDQVMAPLISSTENSLEAHPRKIFVIYQRPMHRYLWDSSKAFQLMQARERYVIYESKR